MNNEDYIEITDPVLLNKYGKYKVYLKIKNEYKIAIGPDWLTSLLGYLIMLILFVSFYTILEEFITKAIKMIYIILFTTMSIIFILIFTINPGIAEKQLKKEDEENKKVLYNCYRCFTLYGTSYQHCKSCDVCVKNLDHHCGWMGKCITSYNLCLFYSYIANILAFFLFTLFMVIFSLIMLA